MIKHVVTMDKDDFDTLIGAIHAITNEVDHMEESPRKGRLKRYLGEIEDALGAELPPIPEAVTARWVVSRDSMTCTTYIRCANCNEMRAMHSPSHTEPVLPSVCPNCKAVMTGVE